MSRGGDAFYGKEVVESKITAGFARTVGDDGVVKDI